MTIWPEVFTAIFRIDENQWLRPCTRPQTSVDVYVELEQFCCNDVQRKTGRDVQSGPTRTAQALTAKAIEAMKPGPVAYRVPDLRCKA